MVNDTKGGGKKGQSKGKGKGSSTQEIESNTPTGTIEVRVMSPHKKDIPAIVIDGTSESSELANPLMDEVEHLKDGTIMLAGNKTLISLNLSNNQIGEEGLKELALAIGYQTTMLQFTGTKNGNGLMRLCVNRNKVPKTSETLNKLMALMVTKDPYYKPPPSPDAESQVSKN